MTSSRLQEQLETLQLAPITNFLNGLTVSPSSKTISSKSLARGSGVAPGFLARAANTASVGVQRKFKNKRVDWLKPVVVSKIECADSLDCFDLAHGAPKIGGHPHSNCPVRHTTRDVN